LEKLSSFKRGTSNVNAETLLDRREKGEIERENIVAGAAGLTPRGELKGQRKQKKRRNYVTKKRPNPTKPAFRVTARPNRKKKYGLRSSHKRSTGKPEKEEK